MLVKVVDVKLNLEEENMVGYIFQSQQRLSASKAYQMCMHNVYNFKANIKLMFIKPIEID